MLIRVALCLWLFFGGISVGYTVEKNTLIKQLTTLDTDIKKLHATILSDQKSTEKLARALHLSKQKISQKQTLLSQEVTRFNRSLTHLIRIEREGSAVQKWQEILHNKPGRTGIIKQIEKQLLQEISTQKKSLHALRLLQKKETVLYQEQKKLLQKLQNEQKNLTRKRIKILALIKIKDKRLAHRLSKKLQLKKIMPLSISATHRRTKGGVLHPVMGHLIQKWHDTDASGLRAKGVIIQGEAKGKIRVVHAGMVLYAGDFRTYGGLVIIGTDDNQQFVYGGVSGLTKEVGDRVKKGNVIGYLDEKIAPTLYFEVRQNGTEVNPKKWID